MRTLNIIFLLLYSVMSLSAQRTESLYECIYEYTIQGEDKKHGKFKEQGYCMLQIGNGIGKFYDYSSFQTDSVKQSDEDDKIIGEYIIREQRNVSFFDEVIYQNDPKGKMSVKSVLVPNFFNYEENRFPFQWTLIEGTDTICGYKCNIAQGEYGGRKWTVKYAQEIPSQNGPWKLTGLPGLVLDATDSEGIHHFSAVSFRKGTTDITPLNNQGSIRTTRNEFVNAKNKFEENPIGNIPPEAIGDMEIRKFGDNSSESTILINGIQLRLRSNPYIPLELE